MPDPESDPAAGLEAAQIVWLRRRRARSIVMFLALLLWVVIIYVAVMVKINNDIRHG